MGANGTTDTDLRDRGDTARLPVPHAAPPPPVLPDEAPLDVEPPDGAPVPQTRRPVPRSVWFFVVVAVLIVAMGLATSFVIRALGDANPFKDGIVTQRTTDRSGPAVLRAVNDLGRFQAASGYYEVVIDVEKSVDNVPSIIAGSRVLFVAAGNVGVSVDLTKLGAGAVTVDEARTSASIVLPKPQLAPAALDLPRSYVYSQEQGLLDRLRGGDAQDMKGVYDLATKRLDEAARQSGELTARAETNTRAMLQGLLRSLGFTDVTVTFR